MQRISSRVKGTQRVGSRAQVMHGNAKMTGGGLRKKDLKYNKQGKIVSKKMSQRAKKEKRLQKTNKLYKMRGGAPYKSYLTDNEFNGLQKLLTEINSELLSNITITNLEYSNNLSDDPNPYTMLFKGVKGDNEYFIKVGIWNKPYTDSRNILTEREAYTRLNSKYPNNSTFATMIGAKSFKIDESNRQIYGVIVLEFKDLSGYDNPKDKTGIEASLKLLEDAGVIHLDIVGNIKVNKTGDIFLMDFELADISVSIPEDDDKLEHKEVYNVVDMADHIIKCIKDDMLPPTPERKRRRLESSPPMILDNSPNSPNSPTSRTSLTSPDSPSRRQSIQQLLFRSPSTPSTPSTPLPPGTPEPPEPVKKLEFNGGNKKRNSRRKKK